MREQFNFITDLIVKRPEYWQDRHRERQKVKAEYQLKRIEELPKIALLESEKAATLGVKRGKAFFTPGPRAGIKLDIPSISLRTKLRPKDREFTEKLVNCDHSDSDKDSVTLPGYNQKEGAIIRDTDELPMLQPNRKRIGIQQVIAFNSAFKDINKLAQKGVDKIDAKVAYLKTLEE